MKKFLAMLLVLTLTLALLAGCGAPAADKGSEGSEPVDPAQTDATDNGGSAEPVTLKVGPRRSPSASLWRTSWATSPKKALTFSLRRFPA